MPTFAPPDREIAIIFMNTNIDGGGEGAWYNGDDDGFLKNFFAGTIYAGYREGGTGPFAFVPNNSTASTALSTTAMETQLSRNWYLNQFGGQLILQLHLARKAAPFELSAASPADSQVWSSSKVANARGIVRKLADRFPNATGRRGIKIWLGPNEADLGTKEVVYPVNSSTQGTAISRFIQLDRARWLELRGPDAPFKHPGILGPATTSAQALLGGTGTFRIADYLTYNNGEVLDYIECWCTTNHHKNMGPEDGTAGMWGAEPAAGVQTFYRIWKALEAARAAYGAGAPKMPVLATEWGNGLKDGNYIGTLSGEWATDDNTQNGKHILRTYRLGLAVNALFYWGVTAASFYSLAFSPAEHDGPGSTELEKTRTLAGGTQNLYYKTGTTTIAPHQPEANVAARIWDMRRYIMPIDGRLTIPTKTWKYLSTNLDNGFHVPYTWAVCAPAYNQPDGTSLDTAPWASWREVTFPGGGEIVSAAGVKKIVCRPVFLPRHTDWTVEAEVKCTGSGVAKLCVRGYDLENGLAFTSSAAATNTYTTIRVTFRPKGHRLPLPNAARAVVCLFHNGTGEARMRNVSIYPAGSSSPSAEPLAVTASATPVTGNVPLAVTFSSTATGGTSPYTYAWAFGDSGTSAAQNPAHTYSTAGTYTARCTVTDSTGATASATVGITATNAASTLVATATASPTSGDAPLSVTFGGSATGGTAPYTYAWAFGDGGTSTTQNPTHNYTAAGTYTATLTVTDSASATDADTKAITVTVASGDSCLSSTSNLFLNPCSAATATKRPIGSNATYRAVGHAYTVSWLKGGNAAGMLALNAATSGWGAGFFDCSSTSGTTSVTVRARSDASDSTKARLPITTRVPTGFNASVYGPEGRDNTVLLYDGTNFRDFWKIRAVTENSIYEVGAFPGAHAAGGQGHGGSPRSTSASGIWHEAMTIRGHEWNNAATGKCEHMLGIGLGSKSTHTVGAQIGPSFVWPASSGDNSMSLNTGTIPYGTIFAIPPPSKGGPDPADLSLGAATSLKARLYWQMRNYGWVVCDQSNNPSLRCDQVLTEANRAALQTAARALYPYMRPIENVGTSGSNPIGGGTPVAPNCAFNRSSTITLRNVAYWESRADLAADLTEFSSKSTSSDSLDYYTLAYSMTGHVAMYRATGLTKYLDRALLYVSNVISKATTQAGGYLGWKSGGVEVSLYEVYFWRYVCELLDAMTGLTGDYATQRATILAFTEANIWDKWYSRGVNSNIYRSVVHICSHWATISDFIVRNSANATRVTNATTIRDNIDHAGMAPWNGDSIYNAASGTHPNDSAAAYWRMYWPKVAGGGDASGIPSTDVTNGSDTRHGSDTFSWIVEAYDRGYGPWGAADMGRFIKLFGIVWPEGDATPFEWFIGTGSRLAFNPNTGFLKLGRYSRTMQKRLEGLSAAANIGRWGNMALNAKILGET